MKKEFEFKLDKRYKKICSSPFQTALKRSHERHLEFLDKVIKRNAIK